MIGEFIMTGATQDEVWPLVRDFHYSGRMSSNIQNIYVFREAGGLFGDFGEEVLAAAIFSIPPARWSENVLELSRLVRTPDFNRPLTQLLAFACKQLKGQGVPLLVSYADWGQEHHGGIYQAASWNYSDIRSRGNDGLIVDGEFVPGRSANSIWGTRSPSKAQELMPHKVIEPHLDVGKHLYWRALNKEGGRRAERLGLKSLPYPKPKKQTPEDFSKGA